MRRLLFIAPILAFAVLIGVFFAGLHRDPTLLPSMMIGKRVPTFDLAAVRPGDQGLRTGDLGGEPVLLNYYASWCVACRAEHPMLMRLRAEGVPIHGVDWKDEPEAGNKWLIDRGDPYLRVGNDRSGRTGIDMGVSGVPETFIIDKQGRVRYRHVGAITEEDWSQKIGPLMQRLKAES
ncbi:DsbE family thiol:disulfide interchange protein [Phenylobacterium sp.]|uniref:DsbE family thiol:disulfide interchange protein n=1 Tax=Phenylobacterium sp. TaxID=1871053 RepID=UPI0025DB74EE|nr:DsbE family thiol:disulfide interchange protein [Phenylobacterium sp.]